MKIVKKILIAIGALIALLLIVALFVKNEYIVEREITINRPKQEVFDYIKLLKNQDNYGVWNLSDPDMKQDYTGTDGTVGFVSYWDGEKAGKGEQKITRILDGERLETELRFDGWDDPARSYLVTEAEGEGQTRVVWGMVGNMSYPFNLMAPLMGKMIGDDYEKGLETLKEVLEQ